MNSALIEMFLGLYFIVVSVSSVRTMQNPMPKATWSLDLPKLILGVILLILALVQGLRLI